MIIGSNFFELVSLVFMNRFPMLRNRAWCDYFIFLVSALWLFVLALLLMAVAIHGIWPVIPFYWSEVGALEVRFFWFQWYSLENMFQIGFFGMGFRFWRMSWENVYLWLGVFVSVCFGVSWGCKRPDLHHLFAEKRYISQSFSQKFVP